MWRKYAYADALKMSRMFLAHRKCFIKLAIVLSCTAKGLSEEPALLTNPGRVAS